MSLDTLVKELNKHKKPKLQVFPGIRLKHYKSYIRKLGTLAKGMGITVEWSETDDGIWLPTKKKIKLSKDGSQAHIIATLLHEIGHVIDELSRTDPKEIKKVDRAYTTVYTDKPHKRHLAIVLKVEKQAWLIGKKVGDMLGIDLGTWYNELGSEALASYRDV